MPCKFQIIMIAALFIFAIATRQDTTSTAGEFVQSKSGPVKVERLATPSEPWGMTFLPDGKLFITSGDRLRFDPAQDMSTNLGKIVRINPDGSFPSGNPFINKKGIGPDIWSLRQLPGTLSRTTTGIQQSLHQGLSSTQEAALPAGVIISFPEASHPRYCFVSHLMITASRLKRESISTAAFVISLKRRMDLCGF